MRHLGVGLIPFPERLRQSNVVLRYILSFWGGSSSLWGSRRRRYLYWKRWFKVFYFSVPLCILLWFLLRDKLSKTETRLFSNEVSSRSRNVRVPQYLLLDIDNNGRSKCQQMFETNIPHIARPNITDRDLVQSLLNNKLNQIYALYSYSSEEVSITRSKLCSNISNEWILFTILEKETLEKSIDENTYEMENALDGSEKTTCESLDFKECSLNNLKNDFPRLFQFDHEQHIKKINTFKKDMPIEIVHIVYHYIRRKAVDYIEYKNKLARINFVSFNITILTTSITSTDIHIKIKIIQNNNASFTDMNCLATLQRKDFNRVQTFQMINPMIHFDQLASSTSYNICASCQGVNEVCKKIKTLYRISSIQLQTDENSVSVSFDYVALVALILPIMSLIIFGLFATTRAVSRRLRTRSDQNPTGETTNQGDERSIPITPETADDIDSIGTRSCRSAEDLSRRVSFSSMH